MSQQLVVLPDEVVDGLWAIAQARHDLKADYGVTDRKISDWKDPVLITFQGLYAEAAVAAYLGLMIETDVSITGDGGVGDLTLPSGETMQVKLSFNPDWAFALRSDNPKGMADRFGWLVVPAKRSDQRLEQGVQIVGFFEATMARLMGQWSMRDYGYGPRAVITHERLLPPDMFEEYYG